MLEYHLETLTNRSLETQFANFARHIAEREICPNLLPQTGPTGGGDSKVDSETYPVAEAIALGWLVGYTEGAASHRWGFAFSTMKAWQAKLKADIAKIVETGRGYERAFFVTSRYVRDKRRAELEDELTRKNGLDVRILDRTWILDKVFKNGHEQIAIEDLQIQTSVRRAIRKGPLDAQREADLQVLESRIREGLRLESPTKQVVDDCIEAADRARQLERPRTELDGLYERAERVAVRYGTEQQRFICAYQRAWTAYWWHEDYDQFTELYQIAEERAKETENAYLLELLTNLWSLLHSAVIRGNLDERRSNHAKRTEFLSKQLKRLSSREDQLSTALQARALSIQMSLILSLRTNNGVDGFLREFQDLLRKSQGLAGFPFEPLAQILIELGEPLGHLPAYDELFGVLVELQTERKKEHSAAQMLLTRGTQQLQADRPYDAIRSLGLSLSRLYKHESRREAVTALYLCGCAYEEVDLLWAARGTLLSAASLATGEFYTYEEITTAQAACYRALKWVELRLGRVSHALRWHQIDIAVRRILRNKGALKYDEDEEIAFDGTLGILLLRTPPWELRYLVNLPDALDAMGLFNAWAAALYALGYKDELTKAHFPEPDFAEDLHAYFLQWRDHPSGEEVASEPSFYEETKVMLVSNVLGCRVTVESDNSSPCVELSESILAALESLLSTGTTEWLVAREPTLAISVRKSELAKSPFEFELDDSTGRPRVFMSCPSFDAHSMPRLQQTQYKEHLLDLLASLLTRITMGHDLKETLTRLFRDELAIDRSVNFTGSFVTAANVLGKDTNMALSAWAPSGNPEFVPKRTERWDADDAPRQTPPQPSVFRPGQGEPPEEVRDHTRVRQGEIQTVSLIRETLWEKARWSGTGFATAENGDTAPILALSFEDPKIGKEIFRHWKDELGPLDARERLRISIIRAISRSEPHSYRVAIGSNPETASTGRRIRYMTFVSRSNTMHPVSDANLVRFLEAFNRSKSFYLAPAFTRGRDLVLIDAHWLLMKELHIREAWQIGRHDPDSHAIYPGDSPTVPAEQANPPVAELLQWKATRMQSSEPAARQTRWPHTFDSELADE